MGDSNVLGKTQLQKLLEHKYSAQGTSIAEVYLQPFWRYVVEFMPLWLAPNTITTLGLAVNIITSALIMYICPLAVGEICPSALICCCAGLLIYQTLDAIDGKQARRTGSSSPLGELFDHGCDSLSVVFVSLAMACTLNLGKYPHFLFFFFFNNSVIFYLAHWQTYVTGILVFGRVDVTEVQILGCGAFILTAIFGVQLWSYEVTILGANLSLAQLAVIFAALNSFYYMLNSFSKILAGGVGKNKSTVSDTSVLSPAIPLGIVLACAFYVYKHSELNLFQTAPCLVDLMYGITIAKLTCKLVIATMTKHPLEMIDSCMLGPAALSFIIYFSLPVSEWHALLAVLAFECLNMAIFCTKVCVEISSFLGIDVFHIKEKKAH
eukprot:gene8613-14625_t